MSIMGDSPSPSTEEFELDIEPGVSESYILRKFIEIYKNSPVLWNPNHKDYMKKVERNKVLDKLKQVYEQLKPGCKRDDVKRKINTLRSNYRKEMKKIKISKNSGCSAEDVYIPKSWVFYALKFLENIETPANQPVHEIESVSEDASNGFEIIPQNSLSTYLPVSVPTQTPVIKKPKISEPVVQPTALNLLEKACSYLEEPQENTPHIARAWGEILISLPPDQRLFAEKAINDVLFEARLGTLNRYSVRINEGPNLTSSNNTNNSN